ncbi:uncharacterized protein BDZ99DRAFT_553221 [Mytilinidion resinicola]|uniref:Uncharacterized protein n=1 Tax=Mytilinidion resinicola TaxID=574789 RepID=A0A6A6XZM6_9PEZI|nr:uncharacterized protein BDZ99DRAFT_553221 [Mytilinidion resinicola]KAF2801425.1 hypothetical protein BDZ99DRAFT_553221 [Mytilinidion resinicola]
MGPTLVAAAFRPLLLRSPNPYSIFMSSGERTLTRNAAEKPAGHAGIRNGDAYQISKAVLNMLAIPETRLWSTGAEGVCDEPRVREVESAWDR